MLCVGRDYLSFQTFGEVLSKKNEVPRAVVVPCVRYIGLNGLRPWIKSFMDVPNDKV